MIDSMKDSPFTQKPFQPGFAVRLPLAIDVAPLIAELHALGAEPWRVHFNTDYHDGGWSGFVLQSTNVDANTLYAPTAGVSSVSVRPTAHAGQCPALMQAIAAFHCDVKAARVLRLVAGATIREHNDADLVWSDGEARLHIPLLTNPDVAFYVSDERVQMLAGECWYLNLSQPHRVQNRGASERVHLVLDCGVNDWLTEQVQKGSPPTVESSQMVDDATAQFQAFREIVFREPSLMHELRACGRPDELMALTASLAGARGFKFSVEDVRAEMNRAQRDWMAQWIV